MYQLLLLDLQTNIVRGLGVASLILSGRGRECGAGSSNPTLSISANLADINYGESLTISWNSSLVTSIGTGNTNFSLDSGQVDGSLVDSPGSDATYTIEGRGDDGSSLTKSVTVHVRQSPKKFLYITDVSQAGAPQILAQLQTFTSLTTDTSVSPEYHHQCRWHRPRWLRMLRPGGSGEDHDVPRLGRRRCTSWEKSGEACNGRYE